MKRYAYTIQTHVKHFFLISPVATALKTASPGLHDTTCQFLLLCFCALTVAASSHTDSIKATCRRKLFTDAGIIKHRYQTDESRVIFSGSDTSQQLYTGVEYCWHDFIRALTNWTVSARAVSGDDTIDKKRATRQCHHYLHSQCSCYTDVRAYPKFTLEFIWRVWGVQCSDHINLKKMNS